MADRAEGQTAAERADAIAVEYLPCRCGAREKGVRDDGEHLPNCNVYQRVALADEIAAAITEAEQRGRNSAATEILESIEADRLRASPGPAYRSGFMFARECAMRAAKRLVVASTLTAPKGNDRE